MLLRFFFSLYVFTSFSVFAQRLSEKPIDVPYTVDQIHAFWDTNLNHIIMEQIMAGKYPIPEIQKRSSEMNRFIANTYPKGIAIHPSWMYNKHSKSVFAGNTVIDGQASISIFVPSFMDEYPSYAKALDGKRMFEVLVVCMFLHEQEHLQKNSLPKDIEELVVNEADTWAKTCQTVLAEFVKRGYPLDLSSRYYWNDWVICGKQNGECWKNKIRKAYNPVAYRRFKK